MFLKIKANQSPEKIPKDKNTNHNSEKIINSFRKKYISEAKTPPTTANDNHNPLTTQLVTS